MRDDFRKTVQIRGRKGERSTEGGGGNSESRWRGEVLWGTWFFWRSEGLGPPKVWKWERMPFVSFLCCWMVALLLLILKKLVLAPRMPQSRKRRPGHLETGQSEWKVSQKERSAPATVRNRRKEASQMCSAPSLFPSKNSVIIWFLVFISNVTNDSGFQEDPGVALPFSPYVLSLSVTKPWESSLSRVPQLGPFLCICLPLT